MRREEARLGFARERSKKGNTPKCILNYTQNTPFSQNTVYIQYVCTLYKIQYTVDPALVVTGCPRAVRQTEALCSKCGGIEQKIARGSKL